MKNPPNVNFDIKASKGETCPYCDKSLVLGINHPLVEVDGKVSHLRCAFTKLVNLTFDSINSTCTCSFPVRVYGADICVDCRGEIK